MDENSRVLGGLIEGEVSSCVGVFVILGDKVFGFFFLALVFASIILLCLCKVLRLGGMDSSNPGGKRGPDNSEEVEVDGLGLNRGPKRFEICIGEFMGFGSTC